ncbi:MAG: right-handed parallel beta-helix repeat-containing protein [Promethearchaeota archaeon]
MISPITTQFEENFSEQTPERLLKVNVNADEEMENLRVRFSWNEKILIVTEVTDSFFSDWVSYQPIYIDGNTDFLTQATKKCWPGTGTSSAPIIITGYNITSPDYILISIRNTDVHFQISNNILNGASGKYEGLFLDNVTHGIINNNTIHDCSQGIYLDPSCSNNTFSDNMIYNNGGSGDIIGAGIGGAGVWRNILSGNSIWGNREPGISASSWGLTSASMWNVSIISNSIWGNVGAGIWSNVSSGMWGGTISTNSIWNNSGAGIWGSPTGGGIWASNISGNNTLG